MFKGKLGGREIRSDGHERVPRLPRFPEKKLSYWIDSPNGRDEYTHQFFRFPAKFHPPVVRWALGNFGRKGSVLLDPFTGSATVQVEALVRGISSVGVDIDPLASLIARAKSTPIDPQRLERGLAEIERRLRPLLHTHADRETRPGADISQQRFDDEVAELDVPAIPSITHWFRKYVIVDLARIFRAIDRADLGRKERLFFRVCAAAIIRSVSNADPAPVSGLEVTSRQAELNAKRRIKVFNEFFTKVGQRIEGMRRLWQAYCDHGSHAKARVITGDTVKLNHLLRSEPLAEGRFPLVITSPPYCCAVEYSRRHRLEMYWLALVGDQNDHLALTHSYVGRKLVRSADWDEDVHFGIKRLDNTVKGIGKVDLHRARAIGHYFCSMAKVLKELAKIVRSTGTVVCVIGDSVCCGIPVATADFIGQLAAEHFILKNRFSYALRNHYMQYGLWNGDGIKQEHVLVLKRKPKS